MAADEQYARQLAEQYNGPAAYGTAPRTGSRGRQNQQRPVNRPGQNVNTMNDDERERSFIDGI